MYHMVCVLSYFSTLFPGENSRRRVRKHTHDSDSNRHLFGDFLTTQPDQKRLLTNIHRWEIYFILEAVNSNYFYVNGFFSYFIHKVSQVREISFNNFSEFRKPQFQKSTFSTCFILITISQSSSTHHNWKEARGKNMSCGGNRQQFECFLKNLLPSLILHNLTNISVSWPLKRGLLQAVRKETVTIMAAYFIISLKVQFFLSFCVLFMSKQWKQCFPLQIVLRINGKNILNIFIDMYSFLLTTDASKMF